MKKNYLPLIMVLLTFNIAKAQWNETQIPNQITTLNKVGIGTTNTNNGLLTLQSSNAINLLRLENQGLGLESILRFRSKSASGDMLHGDISLYATGSNKGYLGIKVPSVNTTNTGYDFIINETGSVGIGTLNPKATLQIGDSDHTGQPSNEVEVKRLAIAPVTHSGSDWFFTARDNNAANLDIEYYNKKCMTIRHDGYIGIGATNPTAKLEILQDSEHADNALVIRENGNSQVIQLHLAKGSLGEYGFLNLGGNTKIRGNGQVSSFDGSVAIGTSSTGSNKLAVEGSIWAQEVKVSLTNAADWVFEEDYNLKSLDEVEDFIKDNKHLPDVPSADEFRENDMNVAEMNNILLQKVEELTLYLIEQNKEIKSLKKEINQLKTEKK